MAASAVELVNEALTRIGADTISSLEAEESPTAAIATSLYQPTVDRLLSEFPWRFATKRVQLSRLAAAPPDPWTYQYALPAGTLRVIRTDQRRENFDLYRADDTGNRVLYSDRSEVWADVVVSIEDGGLFPAHFEEALVAKLAATLAMPITRRFDVREVFMAEAKVAVAKAKSQDWNEAPAREIDDGDSIITSMLSGGF